MASFTAAQALELYPPLREQGLLDRQNKRALSEFSCLCVQACTLLIFLLQLPHPGINNCQEKAPRLSKAQRNLQRRDLPRPFSSDATFDAQRAVLGQYVDTVMIN